MERPIDARLLLYVITVAEEGSITRAAKTKLFVAAGSLAVILKANRLSRASARLAHTRSCSDCERAPRLGGDTLLQVGFTLRPDTLSKRYSDPGI
jgi:hypothetical protein